MNIKYTKDNIQDIIKGCTSIRDAQKKLDLRKTGGNLRLRKMIRDVLITQGTYTGSGPKPNKKTDEVYFTNGEAKRTTWSVRNRLFKSGIKEKICECCKREFWMDKPIPLEVHHIDGDKYNNLLDNLQILCPNCHYFTDTYKTKNRKNNLVCSSLVWSTFFIIFVS